LFIPKYTVHFKPLIPALLPSPLFYPQARTIAGLCFPEKSNAPHTGQAVPEAEISPRTAKYQV